MNRSIDRIPALGVQIVLMVALTAAVLGAGIYWSWQNYLFATEGRVVAATVLRKFYTVSQGRGGPAYHWMVDYGYTAENVLVNAETEIRRDSWDQITERGTMPIVYVPGWPRNSRLANPAENFRFRVRAWVALAVGALAALFVTTMTRRGLRLNAQFQALMTNGFSTRGRVTSMDSEHIGKSTLHFARVEFTDNHGAVVHGRTGPLSSHQRRYWKKDLPILIHFDPTNSTIFTADRNQHLT